ncbi:hypothetical protein B7P43_G16310 [Cryptotermes secundus]|nr:hypothetical protein B7P43_G16310 [Cryptotermes secundus]
MPIDTLSTLARIQRIQYSTLVWLFADAVNNYNEMLLKHQARCKAIVHQQLQIINREATSEELEHLLENSEVAVFVDNIVADTLEAQLALTSVKARHGELLEVESSVKEIRDIFVQMATLVEAQGDNVKRVEFHVVKAGGHADLGNTRLRKAKKLKKKRRKIKFILVVSLIILLGIVLILLTI